MRDLFLLTIWFPLLRQTMHSHHQSAQTRDRNRSHHCRRKGTSHPSELQPLGAPHQKHHHPPMNTQTVLTRPRRQQLQQCHLLPRLRNATSMLVTMRVNHLFHQ